MFPSVEGLSLTYKKWDGSFSKPNKCLLQFSQYVIFTMKVET